MSAVFMLLFFSAEDFHGYGSLTESDNTVHTHIYAIVQGDEH